MPRTVLDRWRRRDGEALALVDEHHRLTWDELIETTERLAPVLAHRVADGQRIAVVGENRLETLVVHATGMLAGIGTVAFSRSWTTSEMVAQIDDADVSVIVTGPKALDAATRAGEQAGIPVLVHGVPGDRRSLEAAIDASVDRGVPTDRPAQAPMVYTSGTTGRARGTQVRWAPVTGTATEWTSVVAEGSTFPDGMHLVVGPLQHNGPLSSLRHLLAGGGVAVMERFDAARVLAWIDELAISSTMMVPTHFTRLLDLSEEQRSAADVSSLRLVSHTGAACSPDVKRAMIDWFGPVLVESYGASEVGTVTRIGSDEWLDHPGSVGRAQPPFEIVIVDDDGAPLPPGQVGRLCIRAPDSYRPRFHADPEKTASVFVTADLFTLGDIGYVDEDGFVHVTDRSADTVVSGGVNVYPAECEAVLAQHPDVSEVAVVGVPHPDLGEALHALVVPVGSDIAVEELDAWVRTDLAPYKCPRSYEQVEELPRNAMGKLDKRSLRGRYWSGDRAIGG